MIFLTETKCKIRFIYVGFNCKRQKWGKKCLEIMTIKGGSGAGGLTPNGKTILNFHFDYWNPSLNENVDIASASHVQEWVECSVKAKCFTEIQTCIGASTNKQNNTHTTH